MAVVAEKGLHALSENSKVIISFALCGFANLGSIAILLGGVLTEVWFKHHPEFSRATYHYDALGRRTHKQLHRHDQRQPEIITFHWQGLKIGGEQSSLRPHNSTTYLYTENSYEPQARIDKTANNWNIYYYHTALNGLPQALTDYGGHIVWKGRYSVWGKRQSETSELTQPQNLRFQGQYYDTETGLHYNTFRYYDPDSGHFTQQDPIGLAGGINQYAYAPNPLDSVVKLFQPTMKYI